MIKRATAALGMILAAVVAFDLLAYLAFPGLVQRIEPEYANDVGPELWRQSRVQRPYQYSETRGFDIKPGDRSIAWHPPEIPPYEVWGNSVGCFDDEPPEGVAPEIYLAGDSFTWGYSPHERKFGTILERETDLLVYACGVPHTGQRHQFDKFLEVAGSFPGWPALVIVNVFTNDLANDRAFPHTAVINGVWYEDRTLGEEPDPAKIVGMTREEKLAASSDFRYYVKTYSATTNIMYEFIKISQQNSAENRSPLLDMYDEGTFPIRWEIAAEHRDIIRKLVRHAKDQGYQIRFALIPGRYSIGDNMYAEYKKFLDEIGAIWWDFEAYVLSNDLDPMDLYWKVDFHFNPEGNAAYADFLQERLDAEARAGTLPAVFARDCEP